jgi:hypothetical protein
MIAGGSSRDVRRVRLPIHRLLAHSALGPEEIQVLCSAYEEVIGSLGIPTVPRAIAEAVARKVIAIAASRPFDRERLVARVQLELGLTRRQDTG